MELQDREKNILAILSVVVVALTYWYLVKPSLEKNEKTVLEISSLENELANPKVTNQKYKDLQKDIEGMQKDIDRLTNQIPDTEKRGFLIKDIEKLAREDKIELIEFVPKDAVPVTISGQEITERMRKRLARQQENIALAQAKVLKTVIEISSKGKFSSYKKFFKNTISYYRAVEVIDISMSVGQVGDAKVDKRFAAKKTRGKKLPEPDMDLNVNFTLIAYTSIPQEN